MKSAVVAVCLFVLVIAVVIWGQIVIKGVSTDLQATINELQVSAEIGDWDNISAIIDELIDKWDKSSVVMSILLNHNDIDTVNATMVSMKQNARFGEKHFLMTNTAILEDQIRLLSSKEYLAIENIM